MNKLMYSAEEVNQILFEITLDKAKVEEKLERIEQIVNDKHYSVKALEYEIKEVLENGETTSKAHT